jgi:YggT family protein
MLAIWEVVHCVLRLYQYIVVATAVMSWLIAFNVVNIRNDLVRSIWNMLVALTEPVLRPIRRWLPNTGAVDISPVILLLILLLVDLEIVNNFCPACN